MLLAIDSSAGTSAAVLRAGGGASDGGQSGDGGQSDDGELLSLVLEADPFGHAESIGRVIRHALLEAEVAADEITAVAMGRGPAPYTGLRVGMAAAVAFAAPRRLPVLGVVALDAVAQHLCEQNQVSPDAEFAVASDAKRREFFVARYRATRPMVEVVAAATVATTAPVAAYLDPCNAGMIARYAWLARQSGFDLSDVSALYLRSPDVMPSSGKRVTG